MTLVHIKHFWNTFGTSLKHPQNSLETPMKKIRIFSWPQNRDHLKNENNLKIEEYIKNEHNLKNEDVIKQALLMLG